MGQDIVSTVRKNLEAKSSEELLKIWEENDRSQWTDEAFEAVKQILLERGRQLPPQSTAREAVVAGKPLVGIGGWLIFPAIALCLAPFMFIWGMAEAYSILNDSEYEYVLDRFEGLSTLLGYEIFANAALLIFGLAVAVVFFRKLAITPRLFIAMLVTSLVLSFIDVAWLAGIVDMGSEVMEQAYIEVARVVIAAVVWIPYFLKSRRVQATFVN